MPEVFVDFDVVNIHDGYANLASPRISASTYVSVMCQSCPIHTYIYIYVYVYTCIHTLTIEIKYYNIQYTMLGVFAQCQPLLAPQSSEVAANVAVPACSVDASPGHIEASNGLTGGLESQNLPWKDMEGRI